MLFSLGWCNVDEHSDKYNFYSISSLLGFLPRSLRSNHEIISPDIRMIENEEKKEVETNCLN